jgi:hypothetical protein
LQKRKRVRLIRYPDEPDADMYWVKFDDDPQPIRQVKSSWLVKDAGFAKS